MSRLCFMLRREAISALVVLACMNTVMGQTDPKRLRELLNGKEFGAEGDKLIEAGESAFAAYEAILADPKARPLELSRLLGVLKVMKGERTRFREHAVRFLAHEDGGVRWAAVMLLAEIGTIREASPIVALLSDGAAAEDKVVCYSAANTLVKIGGPRELIAMDAWLLGVSHRDDPDLRRHVKKCRERLKERLDAEGATEKK